MVEDLRASLGASQLPNSLIMESVPLEIPDYHKDLDENTYNRIRPHSRPISQIDWFQSPQQKQGSYKAGQNLMEILNIIDRKGSQDLIQFEHFQRRHDQIFRKTKIMCTLGKNTSSVAAICEMLDRGMDMARINMCMINSNEHEKMIEMVRKAEKITKKTCGIMVDLQGPVVRICDFKNNASHVNLKADQEFRLCSRKKLLGDETFAVVDYSELPNKLKVGDQIIVDFGSVALTVVGFENEKDFLERKEKESLKDKLRQVNSTSLSYQGSKAVPFHQLKEIHEELPKVEQPNYLTQLYKIDESQVEERQSVQQSLRIKFEENEKVAQERLPKEQFERLLAKDKISVIQATQLHQPTPLQKLIPTKKEILKTQLEPIEEKPSSIPKVSTQDQLTAQSLKPGSKCVKTSNSTNNVSSISDEVSEESPHTIIKKKGVSLRKKRAVKKQKQVIICRVQHDCQLRPNKPCYFVNIHRREVFELNLLTPKDIDVIDYVTKVKGADIISVSYVETKEDVLEVRNLLSRLGRHIKIISKIQSRIGLKNFHEILEVSDGITIARGYLGLEVSLDVIQQVQKYIIQQGQEVGKPVLLSTQIMESMVHRLRPTRAEVSDISNAVEQGVDCMILAAETAVGPHYKECVDMMSRILYEAELNIDYEQKYQDFQSHLSSRSLTLSIEETIANAAVKASFDIEAKLIIAFTNTGHTAKIVQKHKPACPILAVSASESTVRQCMVMKGVFYMLVGSLLGAESLLQKVTEECIARQLVKPGDFLVCVRGMRPGVEGGTNLLKIVQA